MTRSLRQLLWLGLLSAGVVVIPAIPTSPAAPGADPPAGGKAAAAPDGGTFPEGQPRVVDFNPDAAVWNRLPERERQDQVREGRTGLVHHRLPERERQDQLRDWVLFAAAGSLGLKADDLSRALADVPVTRRDHVRPTAQPEFGPTRTCDLGGGRALAVVPRGTTRTSGETTSPTSPTSTARIGASSRTCCSCSPTSWI